MLLLKIHIYPSKWSHVDYLIENIIYSLFLISMIYDIRSFLMQEVCKGLQIIIKINNFCRTSFNYIRQNIELDPTLRYTWSILQL